jgi:hypothetical protein
VTNKSTGRAKQQQQHVHLTAVCGWWLKASKHRCATAHICDCACEELHSCHVCISCTLHHPHATVLAVAQRSRPYLRMCGVR